MAAIGEPVKTYEIPDPEEVPDEIPQAEPAEPVREPGVPVPA
jgi:hypothetical protein